MVREEKVDEYLVEEEGLSNWVRRGGVETQTSGQRRKSMGARPWTALSGDIMCRLIRMDGESSDRLDWEHYYE